MLSKIKPSAIILAVILIAIVSIVLPLLAQIPSSASPQLRFRESDQTLPAGLWRLRLNGDVFTLEQNTAAAGNFSTLVTPVTISPATGDATFLGQILSSAVAVPADIATATGTPRIMTIRSADTTEASFAGVVYGNNAIGGIARGLKTRAATPTAVGGALLENDEIWVPINAVGSDGTNWRQGAAIAAEADGNWSEGVSPARWVFWTMPATVGGTQKRQMMLDSNGDLYPSSVDNPDGRLGTAAIPWGETFSKASYTAGDFGQFLKIQRQEQLVSINNALTTDSAIGIPAGAVVLAVSVRTTVSIPGAATYDVGIAGATTRYGTAISATAGSTNPGTDDGTRVYPTGPTAIRFTPNAIAGNTGRVRLTIWYYESIPPTS